MPKKSKKTVARRSPALRSPPRRQTEAPRPPARRQTEAPRPPAHRQVLPPESADLASARAQDRQTPTTQPPPPRQPPITQPPPRQPPTTQPPPPRQPTQQGSDGPYELIIPPELAHLPSARDIQVAQVWQTPATQPPPPRQPPTSQSGTRARELLSSQETIETIPSRLQSQQSAPQEMISSQESITSRVQNQLLLSQTSAPEHFEEPPRDIRGGDYDTSLNYQVEDEHIFGESSTAGMIRGAILEADARPTIPSASRRPERSTRRRERRQSPNELLPKGA